MSTRCALALLLLLALAGCKPAPAPRPGLPPWEPKPAPAPVTPKPPEPPARVWLKGTREVPVIMYHDVTRKSEVWFDLATSEFEHQLAAMEQAGAHVVPLKDLVAHLRDGAPLPERAIVLTFDDGCLGNYTEVLPLLRKYRYPATFFVHTDYVGRKTEKQHMTWEQLRECEQSGLVDVEPHTVTHPEFLEDNDEAGIRAELRQSREAVEKELGHKAVYYAHPYGNGADKVAKALDELGYEAAWNEVRAPNASPADRFNLPRYAPKRVLEVLAKLQQPSPSLWVAGPLELKPGASQTDTIDGVKLTWQPAELPGTALYRDGTRKLSEGEQLNALRRPLLARSASQAIVARFGGWMNPATSFKTPPNPLTTLLPGVQEAVLGKAWLVHDGKALPATGQYRAAAGVTADGRIVLATAAGSTAAGKLAAALVHAGAVEALAM